MIKQSNMISIVSYIYSSLSQIRNILYDINFLKQTRFSKPIISVGNITSGGTGKTPVVIDLCMYIKKLGFVPGVISRGYGRDSKVQVIVSDGKEILSDFFEAGDEPLLIAQSVSGIPIIVDNNKLKGIEKLLQYNVDIIIMDDGYQSRKIERDLDIVMINTLQHNPQKPYLLNSAILREPLSSLKRASIVITSRNQEDNRYTWVNRYTDSIIIESLERTNLVNNMKNKKSVFNKRIKLVSFSGIADSSSFTNSIKEYNIVNNIIFKDHVLYGTKEINALSRSFEKLKVDGFITTMKDYIKLPKAFISEYRIYILEYIIGVSNNKEIQDQINRLLQK